MPKIKGIFAGILAFLFCAFPLSSDQSVKTRPAEEILQLYVEDFRSDPAAVEPIMFGVRISGEGA